MATPTLVELTADKGPWYWQETGVSGNIGGGQPSHAHLIFVNTDDDSVVWAFLEYRYSPGPQWVATPGNIVALSGPADRSNLSIVSSFKTASTAQRSQIANAISPAGVPTYLTTLSTPDRRSARDRGVRATRVKGWDG